MVLGVKVSNFEPADKKIYSFLRVFAVYRLPQIIQWIVRKVGWNSSRFGIRYNGVHVCRYSPPRTAFSQTERVLPPLIHERLIKNCRTELPPLEMWKNTLDNGKSSISSQEFEKAKHMWEIFEYRFIQVSHDCYLQLDFVLLACCSGCCRKLNYQTYRLDVATFFTAPNLAEDAALGITKADVELMTEPGHLQLIEPSVRGSLTSVIETR